MARQATIHYLLVVRCGVLSLARQDRLTALAVQRITDPQDAERLLQHQKKAIRGQLHVEGSTHGKTMTTEAFALLNEATVPAGMRRLIFRLPREKA